VGCAGKTVSITSFTCSQQHPILGAGSEK